MVSVWHFLPARNDLLEVSCNKHMAFWNSGKPTTYLKAFCASDVFYYTSPNNISNQIVSKKYIPIQDYSVTDVIYIFFYFIFLQLVLVGSRSLYSFFLFFLLLVLVWIILISYQQRFPSQPFDVIWSPCSFLQEGENRPPRTPFHSCRQTCVTK